MKGIGGNTQAIIQIFTASQNEIGETVKVWTDVQTLNGWLDLQSGNSRYNAYHAKIQESTHIFVSDYICLDSRITAENARMVINGGRYDVMLIDNPMGMGAGSQLEIYLKYTGGQ